MTKNNVVATKSPKNTYNRPRAWFAPVLYDSGRKRVPLWDMGRTLGRLILAFFFATCRIKFKTSEGLVTIIR
jgi:hypothetical protein